MSIKVVPVGSSKHFTLSSDDLSIITQHCPVFTKALKSMTYEQLYFLQKALHRKVERSWMKGGNGDVTTSIILSEEDDNDTIRQISLEEPPEDKKNKEPKALVHNKISISLDDFFLALIKVRITKGPLFEDIMNSMLYVYSVADILTLPVAQYEDKEADIVFTVDLLLSLDSVFIPWIYKTFPFTRNIIESGYILATWILKHSVLHKFVFLFIASVDLCVLMETLHALFMVLDNRMIEQTTSLIITHVPLINDIQFKSIAKLTRMLNIIFNGEIGFIYTPLYNIMLCFAVMTCRVELTKEIVKKNEKDHIILPPFYTPIFYAVVDCDDSELSQLFADKKIYQPYIVDLHRCYHKPPTCLFDESTENIAFLIKHLVYSRKLNRSVTIVKAHYDMSLVHVLITCCCMFLDIAKTREVVDLFREELEMPMIMNTDKPLTLGQWIYHHAYYDMNMEVINKLPYLDLY